MEKVKHEVLVSKLKTSKLLRCYGIWRQNVHLSPNQNEIIQSKHTIQKQTFT